MFQKTRKIISIYFITLMFGLGLVGFVIYHFDPSLKIYFLDIGQGDATLIKTPDDRYVLIDGGPDNQVVYKLGKYLPFYQRTIDLIVLTHPDNDHLVGLSEVLERYRVKNILLTGVADSNPAYQDILRLIDIYHVNYLTVGQLQGIKLNKDINLDIIYPTQVIAGKDFDQDNDWSIVNRLTYGDQCMIFTGDAPKRVERLLVEGGEYLDCQILKIGHHGSDTSSDFEFLQAVSPDLAVVSVGENRFGHPKPEVISRLEQLNIRFLTTKDFGDIMVILEKSNFIVE